MARHFSVLRKLMKSIDAQKPVDIDREIAEFLESSDSFAERNGRTNQVNRESQDAEAVRDPHAEAIARIVKAEMDKPFVRMQAPYAFGDKSEAS